LSFLLFSARQNRFDLGTKSLWKLARRNWQRYIRALQLDTVHLTENNLRIKRGAPGIGMNRDKENLIALFIDFDNIAIGLKESGGKPFEVRRVLERLLEKGRLIYKRAYADWYQFSDSKHSLHEHAIEMIDIPMRRNIGKNSADIRLVVDALDLCYTKEHINTFVIGSGDSDFTPLVSKLKENDKVVIGFGLEKSTSNLLANNCDEFIFYEDLVSLTVNRPTLPAGLTKRQFDSFSLVLDAVAALMRENKDVLWGSLIKDAIRRKRPSFTEGQYGYSSFSMLLEDVARHQLIGLIKDPKSGGTPVVTGFGLIGEGGSAISAAGSMQAAPASAKGPSLLVNVDSTRLLPTTNGDEEKPKPSRSRSRRRPAPRKTAAQKAEEKAAAEAKASDTTATAETTETTASTEEKVEIAAKTPARRSPRRRSTAKPKTASESADVKVEDSSKAESKLVEVVVIPEKEETATKPRKPARRRSTAAAKKTPATDTTKAAAKPETKAVTKPKAAKPAAVKVEPQKVADAPAPKGEPLRTRVRRRRR
jgi:uncharacterized protein (TIGR00288 family)